ncbi:MAG: PSD1 and planctomycete cytochrome C domain-containing protein, partial [Verrucomicrobiota bacterium]|nr:PSD1 and planctomycete cytochrome C domain-containing protein [Verrucomicrobiota bacterium]
ASLLKGGESGAAINLAKPEESLLLAMISWKDEDHEMPPKKKLPDEQIALLTQWVQLGAPFNPVSEIHGKELAHGDLPTNEINKRTTSAWAFKAAQPVPAPKVDDAAWQRNGIDAFVYDRLRKAGSRPNGPLSGGILIRRAYYDLTGLPPADAEVRAFVADKSPNAFERVIDRLLASDRYGEKWGRHWLDLVRFAETNGYERDSRKDLIWKYRDYVIRAFNQDKPYNRFIMEQLAGDELPDRDADSITATGFYRLGIWDDEPADRELARYNYLDDILRTTGETFLGMTIGCARCHDHKIDPISQKDYYSMLSFFSDISPHGKGNRNHVPISDPDDKAAHERAVTDKQAREASLRARLTPLEEEFIAGLAKRRPELKLSTGLAKGKKDAWVVPDANRGKGIRWEFTYTQPPDNWFEIAFDDSKWRKGRSGFGSPGTPGSKVRTPWHSSDIWLRRDFRFDTIPGKLTLKIHHDEDAEVYLNGKQIKTFKGFLKQYTEIDVTNECLDVLQTGRNTLAIHCKQTGGGQYIDAGLLVDQSTTPVPVLAAKYGGEILGEAKLAQYSKLRDELAKVQSTKLTLKTEYAMAVAEDARRKMWILRRGLPVLKGEEVGPAFPSILADSPVLVPDDYPVGKASGKRRVLAEWLSSGSNPMTARVMANRLWQHHFGRGIVRSSNNFGFIGEKPTHPDLLNWLANELVAGGWKLKRIHKLIMMSNTYRMSSSASEIALARDPNNDLMWRHDMRRLSAEEIRDSILNVTGQLNLKMGGPSIYTEVPRDVLATASRPGAAWGKSSEEDRNRRSVYIFVKRSLNEPFLSAFDWADTDNTCDVRFVTTVPTQTLTLLNSKFLNDSAESLANRLVKATPGDARAQVTAALQLTTNRKPTAREVDDGLELIQSLKAKTELDGNLAMQRFCLLALNLNEFLYLD